MDWRGFLKKVLPLSFKQGILKIYDLPRKGYEIYLIKTISKKHNKALLKLRRKERLKVVFFVIHESVWKYELLYKLFEKDARFEPLIVICPYILNENESIFSDMEDAYQAFDRKKYNVVSTFNKENATWLNLKKEICPDVIFFTNPYKLTKKEYYITNWLDSITCYVPYSFMITNRPIMQYDQLLHNLVFRVFYESSFQKELAIKYSRIRGQNSIALGYPGLDELLFPAKNLIQEKVWKVSNTALKKIIWAPHHSIETETAEYNYSNFLQYADTFFEIAIKYKDKVHIAFKPHPILKTKLYRKQNWSKEKTDAYYLRWDNLLNGQLEEGAYIDLFLTSDALIHDSGSFLVEYLSVNKPSLYMIRHEKILNGFTSLGDEVIACQYKSTDKNELISFIEDVVIKGLDPLGKKREKVIGQYLIPPDDNSASFNIFNNISELLSSKIPL